MEIHTFRPKEGWNLAQKGVLFEEDPEKVEKLKKSLISPIVVSVRNDSNAILVDSLRLTSRGYEKSLIAYTRDLILEGYLQQVLLESNCPIEALEF